MRAYRRALTRDNTQLLRIALFLIGLAGIGGYGFRFKLFIGVWLGCSIDLSYIVRRPALNSVHLFSTSSDAQLTVIILFTKRRQLQLYINTLITHRLSYQTGAF